MKDKSKKVAIITFHNVYNYGANLQCYALMKMLQILGFQSKIINYYSKPVFKPYRLINVKLTKNVVSSIIECCRNIFLLQYKLKSKRNFIKFQNNNYIQTEVITNCNQLISEVDKYNYIITGSDQVWNTKITKEDADIYMLNFKTQNNISKISYAASIGTDTILEKERKYLANVVENYNNISVREKSAREILSQEGVNNVEVVLDPVLLHNKEEWNKIRKKSNIREQYIFVYMLQKDYKLIKFVEELSRKLKCRIIHMDGINKYSLKSRAISKAGVAPDEFVDLIANAEFVVMNSFHGLAFSIIYEKQFVVFPHTTRNTRIENLLDITLLKDRMITEENYDIDYYINNKINYEKVNKNLEIEREKSINFLKKALGDSNGKN